MDFKLICVVVLSAYLSGRGKCDSAPLITISTKLVTEKGGLPETTASPGMGSSTASDSPLILPWWKTTPINTNTVPLISRDSNVKPILPILNRKAGNNTPAVVQLKNSTKQKSTTVKPNAKPAKTPETFTSFIESLGKVSDHHGIPFGMIMKK